MNTLLKKMTVWFLTVLIASSSLLMTNGAVQAQKQPDNPTVELLPRTLFPKPAKSKLREGAEQPQFLIVKFHEGTLIRVRDGMLKVEVEAYSESELRLLNRFGLKPDVVAQELEQVNAMFKARANLNIERLFTDKEEDLEQEQQQAQAMSGEEYADLNLFVRLNYQDARLEDAETLLDQLNALGIVELAYAQPIGADAQADLVPATTDFRPSQGYLSPAPGGIDANYAWTLPGGRGTGVKLIDVETGWERSHEDLRPADPVLGADYGYVSSDHGTAVLGVLGAAENSYGMTGIVPQTQLGVSGVFRPFFPVYDMVGALNEAGNHLSRGDVLLIEQHYPGPRTPSIVDFVLGRNQFGAVPIEHSLAEFETIRRLTMRGIIVIEPAGNGQQNLDDPLYAGRFLRPDSSGAIMVGAGTPGSHAPEWFTNFGSRVDLQGWGTGVATLGYGDLFNPGDARQKYTAGFSGTSSASPIVAGAVCSIQGIRRASGLPVLSTAELRTLLQTTGTPQFDEATTTQRIGRLPNLRAAIAVLGLRAAPRLVMDRVVSVSKNTYDVNTGIDVQPGDRVVFTASGDIWSGVFTTLRNDPFGWGPENPGWHLTMARDTFPSRARLFSLLGRLNGGYFFIGRGTELPTITRADRLYLRINHNNHGAGDGSFHCRVQVWR
jgi:serine protease